MEGELRVVEWLQTDAEGEPKYFHRLEQCLNGHWCQVPVFRLQANGNLIPWPVPKPNMEKLI